MSVSPEADAKRKAAEAEFTKFRNRLEEFRERMGPRADLLVRLGVTALACIFVAIATISAFGKLGVVISLSVVAVALPAVYFWHHALTKSLAVEAARIRRTATYGGFKQGYEWLTTVSFWIGFLFITVSISVTLLAARYSPSFNQGPYLQPIIAFIVFGGFALLAFLFARIYVRLHRVKCPNCDYRLSVRSHRPECRDSYSGLCFGCGTLWDLEVSNNTD